MNSTDKLTAAIAECERRLSQPALTRDERDALALHAARTSGPAALAAMTLLDRR